MLSRFNEIEGIGEAFCRDYGAVVLGLMPDVTAPAPEKAGPDGGGAGDESSTLNADVEAGEAGPL